MIINNIKYTNKEIETALLTAISITPDPATLSLIDSGQECNLSNQTNRTFLFKSEGKFIVVAKPPEGVQSTGYALVNKHALKKVKAEYVNTQATPEDLARLFAPRNNNRNNGNRYQRNDGHRNDYGYQNQHQGNQGY